MRPGKGVILDVENAPSVIVNPSRSGSGDAAQVFVTTSNGELERWDEESFSWMDLERLARTATTVASLRRPRSPAGRKAMSWFGDNGVLNVDVFVTTALGDLLSWRDPQWEEPLGYYSQRGLFPPNTSGRTGDLPGDFQRVTSSIFCPNQAAVGNHPAAWPPLTGVPDAIAFRDGGRLKRLVYAHSGEGDIDAVLLGRRHLGPVYGPGQDLRHRLARALPSSRGLVRRTLPKVTGDRVPGVRSFVGPGPGRRPPPGRARRNDQINHIHGDHVSVAADLDGAGGRPGGERDAPLYRRARRLPRIGRTRPFWDSAGAAFSRRGWTRQVRLSRQRISRPLPRRASETTARPRTRAPACRRVGASRAGRSVSKFPAMASRRDSARPHRGSIQRHRHDAAQVRPGLRIRKARERARDGARESHLGDRQSVQSRLWRRHRNSPRPPRLEHPRRARHRVPEHAERRKHRGRGIDGGGVARNRTTCSPSTSFLPSATRSPFAVATSTTAVTRRSGPRSTRRTRSR